MTRAEALANAERVLADPAATQADCTRARVALNQYWWKSSDREDDEVRETMRRLAARRHAIRRGAALSARLRLPLRTGGGNDAA